MRTCNGQILVLDHMISFPFRPEGFRRPDARLNVVSLVEGDLERGKAMSIRNVEATRKRRRLALMIVLVSVAGALLVAAVVVMQKADQGPAGNTETVAPLTTPKEGENREWTPERMRSASPAPVPVWP